MRYFFLVGFVSFFASFAYGDLFSDGVEAYDEKRYLDAEKAFLRLVDENMETAQVLYNLGNSYMRQDKIGLAMAAYLGARRLAPSNPEIKQNLIYAREKIGDNLDAQQPESAFDVLTFWVHWVSARGLLWGSVVFWIFGLFLLAFLRLRGSVGSLRLVALSSVGVSLCLLGASIVAQNSQETWGAVIASEADVYSGRGTHNTIVFSLREGAPFCVEEEVNGWYQILLSDGKVGWISNQFGKVF